MDASARSRRDDHEDEGQEHSAHKAEHAVDAETGAIIGVTVQDGDDSETETSTETLIDAAKQIEALPSNGPATFGFDVEMSISGDFSRSPSASSIKLRRRAHQH